jgi:hypothetical protein
MTSGLVPISAPTTIDDERLGTWASTFLQIASVSAQLAKTPFVPVSLRVIDERGAYDEQTTAANVAAAILTGQEIGLEPMAALRSINVINATPALSALALRALAQRNGHGIWLREATSTRAIVEGLRAGEDGSKVQRITWTMDDAKSRNLSGKVNWRTQPRNMLIARATSEVVRLVAADAVLGIPYSIEELQDGDIDWSGPDDAENADTEPAPRTARRKGGRARTAASSQSGAGAAQIAAPPSGASEPAGQTPEGNPALFEPPEPIADTQKRALHAGFRNLGLKRADQLKVATRVVGRAVTSSSELTKVEASKVLDEIALLKARAVSQEPAETRGNAENPADGAEPPPEDEPPFDAVGPHADEPDGGHMSGSLEDEPSTDEETGEILIDPTAPATDDDFAAVRELFDRAQFPGGRDGQEARVNYASAILGRKLAGPVDLLHGEAAEVAAALRLMAEDMPPATDDGGGM